MLLTDWRQEAFWTFWPRLMVKDHMALDHMVLPFNGSQLVNEKVDSLHVSAIKLIGKKPV